MTQNASYSHPIRVTELASRKPTRFDLRPKGEQLAALAAAIGASSVAKVRFRGEIRPFGRRDWTLEGKIEADVVQPCVVSLQPVTTHVEEDVARRFLSDLPSPAAEEAEMPEDTDVEPLGATIDPGTVLAEALALALPTYPRAPDVELGEAVFTEPGQQALRDGDAKPFASLIDLRDRLSKKD